MFPWILRAQFIGRIIIVEYVIVLLSFQIVQTITRNVQAINPVVTKS